MIDISVVIPAKNRAHTLPYCLDSVINQTYPAREVIVVDDHSTDETKTIAENYRHKGVRVERLTTGVGAQAARNYGILSAKHDWIAFQDSDDKWNPTKLEDQVRELERQGASPKMVVHANGRKFDEASGTLTPIAISRFNGDCYSKLLLAPGPMFPTLLVHRSALQCIGLLDEKCLSFQEWDTAIRLSKHCRFIHIQKPLFDWVCHSTETISKDYKRDLAGHAYILHKYNNEIMRLHGHTGWRSAISRLVWKSIKFREYDNALLLAQNELPFLARQLTATLIKNKTPPQGGGVLLRLVARLPF